MSGRVTCQMKFWRLSIWYGSKLPPALFVADAPALDFINSRATPSGEVVDWLQSGEDFLAWLDQAKLVPPEVIAKLRETPSAEIDAVARKARSLRDWFRGFVVAHMGRPLTSKAAGELASLNEVLAGDWQFHEIVPRRGSAHARGGDGGPLPGSSNAAGEAPSVAAPDRGNPRRIRLHGGFFARQTLRGIALYDPVSGSYAQRCAPLVQHGGLRQSRKTGNASRQARLSASAASLQSFGIRPPTALATKVKGRSSVRGGGRCGSQRARPFGLFSACCTGAGCCGLLEVAAFRTARMQAAEAPRHDALAFAWLSHAQPPSAAAAAAGRRSSSAGKCSSDRPGRRSDPRPRSSPGRRRATATRRLVETRCVRGGGQRPPASAPSAPGVSR